MAGKENPKHQFHRYGFVAMMGMVVLLGLLVIRFHAHRTADRPRNPIDAGFIVPEEAPPIDPATVLGLSVQLPDSPQSLKEEAFQVCLQLLGDEPNRPEAFAVAALTSMRYGKTDEAMRYWQEAIQKNESFSPTWLGLGTIAAERGDYEEAERLLRRALQLNQQAPSGYAQMVEVLLQRAKADEALPIARDFVRRFPESAQSHFWLGQTLMELGRFDEARKAHRDALDRDPGLAPSYYALAVANLRLGDRDAAARWRAEFAEVNEHYLEKERGRDRLYRDVAAQRLAAANTHKSAGDVYLAAGRLIKAEAHWLRGAAIAPDETACRESLVMLYQKQDRPAAGLGVTTELVALDGKRADYWQWHGDFQSRRAQWDDAVAAYRRAIQLAPDHLAAYHGLLRVALYSPSSVPDARQLAQTAASLDTTPQTYVLLAALCQQEGDRNGALDAISRARSIDPSNPQIQQMYEQIQGSR